MTGGHAIKCHPDTSDLLFLGLVLTSVAADATPAFPEGDGKTFLEYQKSSLYVLCECIPLLKVRYTFK
jgi:hypothetical protein